MLRYGLTSGRGITLLLGEAGTGKTTLLQTVLAEIGPETAQCVLLSNPTLSRAEFYEFLSDGFGMNGSAGSKTKFLADFREHLDQRHRRGLVTALLLDEAQSLPSELLEEVRLLSNIETTTDKLLNVLLIGQPELADRLNESGLRQLKQRVALRWEIRTFSLAETAAYVAGRLRIAGGVPADVFSRDAITTVHRLSNGVPRVINVICDNALIGGLRLARSQSRRQWSTTCAAISTFAPPQGPLPWNTHRQSRARRKYPRRRRRYQRREGMSPAASISDPSVRRSGSLSFRARHDISLRDSRHRDHSGSARRMGTGDDTSARA